MNLRGHIMSPVTQVVLEAADAWATAIGLRVASEQKMQFSKAVAKLSIFAMGCLPSVRLDFPGCKNQPQKSKLLQ
jgi:hypothetical protein